MALKKPSLVDDWKAIFKRWSTQIVAFGVAAQVVWGTMPDDARALFPSANYIGIVLGLGALVAMFIKQDKLNGQ